MVNALSTPDGDLCRCTSEQFLPMFTPLSVAVSNFCNSQIQESKSENK